MKRVLVVTATCLALAGCGSSGSRGAKATTASATTSVSLPDVPACTKALTSGKPMTADEVKTCDNTNIVMTYDCDGGGAVHVLKVDTKTWLYLEGKAAKVAPKDYTYDQLAAYC